MFLLPIPKDMKINNGYFLLKRNCAIVLDAQCNFKDFQSAKLLKKEIVESIGFNVNINKGFSNQNDNCIYLRKANDESESYSITILNNTIEICGGDDAGLFYGVQTLRQIIRQYGAELPKTVIKDAPYFKNRGFYHDITRGKVPTLETLKELVDRASFYKINQIQLYIEHTFAFKNLSEVWMDKDPITAEEIPELDEYCKALHVELVPSLSTFGHLYEVLTSKSYSHLCELDGSVDSRYSWVDRMHHHTLDVTNKDSLKLIENMMEEFIPLFSSDKFNICCDETFDLGKGKSSSLAKEIGTGKVYTTFLNKVIDCTKKYGKKVMFWGDIILKHPDLLNEIPKDVTCLNWAYNAAVTEDSTRTIAETGLPLYECPGVAGWNRLMNDMDTAFTNIPKVIAYGKKYGADGVLNTDWGDYGHINLFGNSIPGMIYGAALSWNPEDKNNIDSIMESISTIEYGADSKNIVCLLRDISNEQAANWADIVWWMEKEIIDPELSEKLVDRIKAIDHQKVAKAYYRSLVLEEELLKTASNVREDRKLDVEEFIVSTQGIALVNALFLAIKRYSLGFEHVELVMDTKALAAKFEYWFMDYSKAWRLRNKESELGRIRDAIRYISNFLRANQ